MAKLSFKVLHHFAFPPAVNLSAYDSTLSPALSAVQIPDLGHSDMLIVGSRFNVTFPNHVTRSCFSYACFPPVYFVWWSLWLIHKSGYLHYFYWLSNYTVKHQGSRECMLFISESQSPQHKTLTWCLTHLNNSQHSWRTNYMRASALTELRHSRTQGNSTTKSPQTTSQVRILSKWRLKGLKEGSETKVLKKKKWFTHKQVPRESDFRANL